MIPINVDSNVSCSTFENETYLYVSSVFFTLQGEGIYAGSPCTFIRLAGCNFGSKTGVCTQCDTAFQLSRSRKLTCKELLEQVSQIAESHKCYNLVITGGEPTLQHLILDFLIEWASTYTGRFQFIQIETNGTNAKFYEDSRWRKCLRGVVSVCISPKANEVTSRYVKIPELCLEEASFFKFLLSSDEKSAYHDIPSYYLDNILSRSPSGFLKNTIPVYVSPITVYNKSPSCEVASIFDSSLINTEETRKNYSYAASYVMENKHRIRNLKLSLQTHLFTAIP